MGVDDDFFTRDALLKLVQANRIGVDGAATDVVVLEGRKPMTRAEAFTVLTDEAEEAANNIRSAGDNKREERKTKRIRLNKQQADTPGATSTVKHIYAVREVMGAVVADLEERARAHDDSKLQEPELSGFAQFVERPKHGTPEYDARLKEMEPLLAEHYKNNDHHPEHYILDIGTTSYSAQDIKDITGGGHAISRMPLPAILEMLCDWKARAGDIPINWEYNVKRYEIGKQLEGVLRATAAYYGWG